MRKCEIANSHVNISHENYSHWWRCEFATIFNERFEKICTKSRQSARKTDKGGEPLPRPVQHIFRQCRPSRGASVASEEGEDLLGSCIQPNQCLAVCLRSAVKMHCKRKLFLW